MIRSPVRKGDRRPGRTLKTELSSQSDFKDLGQVQSRDKAFVKNPTGP